METQVSRQNPAWVVKQVKPNNDYTLEIQFNDNTKRVFNATEYINRPAKSALKDKDLFMKAHVAGPTVGWTDELDIAPEYLYEHSQIIS